MSGAPNRTRVDDSHLQQRPTKMRLPVARPQMVSYFVPNSVKPIQSLIIVGIKSPNLSGRPIASVFRSNFAFNKSLDSFFPLQYCHKILNNAFYQLFLLASCFQLLSRAAGCVLLVLALHLLELLMIALHPSNSPQSRYSSGQRRASDKGVS